MTLSAIICTPETPPQTSQNTIVSRVLREALNWPLSMQIGTSLLDSLHRENYVYISFHIEWDMIVGTVFLSILNHMEFHLVQIRKENCRHDHIPFYLKGNGNIVFSVSDVGLHLIYLKFTYKMTKSYLFSVLR